MTVLDRFAGTSSDAELISRVRGGDLDAYGALFERHRDAATRLAHALGAGADADDLVAEAFARVLAVLRDGRGPDLALRPYLLTTVRHGYVDRIRARSRAIPTDDLGTLDSGEEFADPAVAGFDSSAAARAFRSLPERWQLVLWHLEVEGQKPADVAPLLGMTPNAVSALAYRAREGLRQAFLQMHAGDVLDDECTAPRDLLGGYVRQGLSRRDSERVAAHLERCRPCTAVYLELTEVNSGLRGVLAPIVLGSGAAAYLAGSGTSGGAALAGLGVVWGRARDVVTANTQAALAAGAAAVAAVAAVGIVLANTGAEQPVANPGIPSSIRPSAPPSTSTPNPPVATPTANPPSTGTTPARTTGGSTVVAAVATRPNRPNRPSGNPSSGPGGGNTGGNPSTPGTPKPSPTPSQPPVNARTHVLSVGAAVAPGQPLLSLGTTSDLVGSLTHLQLADIRLDLSGLLPGTKLDLNLLR
jgi:RNA polymerase sigma factor (sigma-70 family)